jgi:hypothetical protein
LEWVDKDEGAIAKLGRRAITLLKTPNLPVKNNALETPALVSSPPGAPPITAPRPGTEWSKAGKKNPEDLFKIFGVKVVARPGIEPGTR